MRSTLSLAQQQQRLSGGVARAQCPSSLSSIGASSRRFAASSSSTSTSTSASASSSSSPPDAFSYSNPSDAAAHVATASSLPKDQRVRRPENAPGAFFVDSSCIDCDVCRKLGEWWK